LNIGLTQRILHHKGIAYDCVEHGWYSYLSHHTLSFIQNRLDQDFEHLTNQIDCLIITGGDDSTLRRTVELKLAKEMMKAHKPVLGVCHGCFLLADVLGATVIDVYDHSDTDHEVNYFGDRIIVNSFHSLAISEPHRSATVLAKDDAGYCESWIDGTLAGVVWHPERMATPWLPSEITQLLKL